MCSTELTTSVTTNNINHNSKNDTSNNNIAVNGNDDGEGGINGSGVAGGSVF